MDRSMLYRRFRTLLIANRGEIACRVIRTARAMGLRTVAVYSEADRDAMHVALADEAVLLGPARARDSYLNVERLIEAARKTGAEAVHPGYGFLSENAEFARACLEAGLVFVGPTAAMMTAMGSKSGSKALMEKAGVPLVPGYHGEAQDDATLAKAAEKIGFPDSGEGVRRRRRPRHAHRSLGGRARAGDRQRQARGQGRVRRRPHADRKICRQSPPHRGADHRRQPRQSAVAVRARMHAAAPAPEGDRGGAVADAQSSPARDRLRRRAKGGRSRQLCRRRHHRVRLRRQGRVLHRDEHAPPGRASRDRADHRDRSRRVAAARRLRRGAAAEAGRDPAQRPCGRGARLRGKPDQEFHAVGRKDLDLAPAGGNRRPAHRRRLSRRRYGLAVLRCDARKDDRLGADAGRRDRAAEPRAAKSPTSAASSPTSRSCRR